MACHSSPGQRVPRGVRAQHIGVDVVVAVLVGDVGDLAVSTSDGHQDVCGDPYICHPMCR